MRKFKMLALLLCAIVACSFVLAGCNNGTPTTISARWSDSESFSYTVRAVMLKTNPAFKEEVGELIFVNNFELISETNPVDEFRPSVVTGTFDGQISTSGDTQTFETSQYIECAYRSEDLEAFEVLQLYVSSMTSTERNLVLVSQTDTEIVLKSQTTTKVVFEKSSKQTPISANKTIKGYYAGMSHFEVNDIACQTTYDANIATITLTSNGEKLKDGEKHNVGASSYIDAAQILLYQRSLDQSTAFTQATGVVVFDPITAQTVALSFAINLNTPTKLNLGNGKNLAITTFIAASTTSGVYGVNLYAFFNNPNDKLPITAAGELNKYTPVKWQSGYLLYELSSYTEKEVGELEYTGEEG